jgi:HSP20 family protein
MEKTITKELRESFNRTPEKFQQEQVLPDGTKKKTLGPFVYGYSVTIGPDGKTEVREFGNLDVTNQPRTPTAGIDKRESLIDVVNGDGEVRVLVELPGVEKEDITLAEKADKLIISVDVPKCKYRKEVPLPANIDVDKVTLAYKNGVLDITAPKKKQEKTEKIE